LPATVESGTVLTRRQPRHNGWLDDSAMGTSQLHAAAEQWLAHRR